MRRFILLVITFAGTLQISIGQEATDEFDLQSLADEIFPLQDEDLNYEELYETLVQRLASPLDLNNATAEELRSLFILSETQVKALLDHRTQSPFISTYELQSIEIIDADTRRKLLPFVTVDNRQQEGRLWSRIITEKNNYLLLRHTRTLETRKGYLDTDSSSRYLGSPDRLYARLRIQKANDFSLGFTLKKDAGEPIVWSPKQKGFDFYSYHFQVSNQGIFKSITLGDYQPQFGQGLVLGGGFGMGKGAEPINTLRRSTLGFIPYTSLNESGYFRGAAFQLSLSPKLTLSVFGSWLLRDGSIQSDSVNNSYLTSFLLSGLHRSRKEQSTRKETWEANVGSVIEYQSRSLQAGIIYHQTKFEYPIERKQNLYNQFQFRGDRNENLSLFYTYSFRNVVWFGETAHTLKMGTSVISGLLASVSKEVDASLHLRWYDRDYISLYGNALAENTTPQNEAGLFWGLKYQPNKKTLVAGYVDLFYFPWLRYRSYGPSEGNEWLLKLQHKPSRSVTATVQVRGETKSRNAGFESQTYQLMPGTRRIFLLSIDCKAGRLDFRTRLQQSSFQMEQTTYGFSIYQEMTLNLGRFNISGRYSLFDASDFNNRQYMYERDVWLAYSLTSYSGTGISSYLLMHLKLSGKVDIWLKWTRTVYANMDEIGTGSEAIAGNSKNDLKFQAKFRF